MSRPDWSWRPDAKTLDALRRGQIKLRALGLRLGAHYAGELDRIRHSPRPSRDELDAMRAESEGM